MKKYTGAPVKFEFVENIKELIEIDEKQKFGCDNENLVKAKKNKDDEFYTQLDYINKELIQYKKYFRGKSIFCNCNDDLESNFFKFFLLNFDAFNLTRLVGFSYNKDGCGKKYEVYDDINKDGFIDESDIIISELKQNGGFNTEESIEELKKADIICTNPPFSLFRQYIQQLIDFNKQFLIIGSQNAVGYKDVFPLIKENKIWTGYNAGDMKFKVPADSEPRKVRYWVDETGQKWRSLGNICWFTNLPTKIREEGFILTASYYDDKNKKEPYDDYDNYEAINVNKNINIPKDYYGLMGVPITFITKYSPNQFEIIDKISPYINGKAKYTRIIIKRIDKNNFDL
ncbi:modification methylase [bacterium]|nr:modification methylase [bacterium]